MEFDLEKCAMLLMRSGKRQITEGIKFPIRERFRTLGEKEIYKCLGILAAYIIKHTDTKEKIRSQTNEQISGNQVCSRNPIKGINTWAVLLVKHSKPFLKWTREEPRQMDKRTRKLMTMHRA